LLSRFCDKRISEKREIIKVIRKVFALIYFEVLIV